MRRIRHIESNGRRAYIRFTDGSKGRYRVVETLTTFVREERFEQRRGRKERRHSAPERDTHYYRPHPRRSNRLHSSVSRQRGPRRRSSRAHYYATTAPRRSHRGIRSWFRQLFSGLSRRRNMAGSSYDESGGIMSQCDSPTNEAALRSTAFATHISREQGGIQSRPDHTDSGVGDLGSSFSISRLFTGWRRRG